MVKRKSQLNGMLENVVKDFVDNLAIEFAFDVRQIDLYYYDGSEDENVCHSIFCEECISNCILE